MRHFDIADRDRDRFTLHRHRHGQLRLRGQRLRRRRPRQVLRQRPRPAVVRFGSVFDRRQLRARRSLQPDGELWLGELQVAPAIEQRQRRRSVDPTRDWTTDYTGKVNFFEASLDINAIERTLIRHHRRLEQVERHLPVWTGHRFAAGRAGTAAAGEERAAARRDRRQLRAGAEPAARRGLLVRRLQGRGLRARPGDDFRASRSRRCRKANRRRRPTRCCSATSTVPTPRTSGSSD